MDFITLDDIQDNILVCRTEDVNYANDYLLRKAQSFGLADDELASPCSPTVRNLGAAVACMQCAASMVGSDTTVMTDGSRGEDVYLQKYNVYKALVASIEGSLSYADFAKSGVSLAGKGGVGVIRLSRA
jgi:hypothetical protein